MLVWGKEGNMATDEKGFLKAFEMLELMNRCRLEKVFCDVYLQSTLTTNIFAAHKLVLACISEKMKSALATHNPTGGTKVLQLEAGDNAIRAFIEFTYIGKSDLAAECNEELLELAKNWDFSQLENHLTLLQLNSCEEHEQPSNNTPPSTSAEGAAKRASWANRDSQEKRTRWCSQEIEELPLKKRIKQESFNNDKNKGSESIEPPCKLRDSGYASYANGDSDDIASSSDQPEKAEATSSNYRKLSGVSSVSSHTNDDLESMPVDLSKAGEHKLTTSYSTGSVDPSYNNAAKATLTRNAASLSSWVDSYMNLSSNSSKDSLLSSMEESPAFTCPLCNRAYTQKVQCLSHLQYVHKVQVRPSIPIKETDDKNGKHLFECGQCLTRFHQFGDSVRHVQEEHFAVIFKDLTNVDTASPADIYMNKGSSVNSEDEVNLLICQLCNIKFEVYDDYAVHLRQSHSSMFSSPAPASVFPKESQPAPFSSMMQLEMAKQIPTLAEYPPLGPVYDSSAHNYHCYVCQKVFPSYNEGCRHMLLQHNQGSNEKDVQPDMMVPITPEQSASRMLPEKAPVPSFTELNHAISPVPHLNDLKKPGAKKKRVLGRDSSLEQRDWEQHIIPPRAILSRNPYLCKLCKQEFDYVPYCKDHIRREHKISDDLVNVCFTRAKASPRRAVMFSRLPAQTVSPASKSSSPANTTMGLQSVCSINGCSKDIPHVLDMAYHKYLEHDVDLPQWVKGHECPMCSKHCFDKSGLASHLLKKHTNLMTKH